MRTKCKSVDVAKMETEILVISPFTVNKLYERNRLIAGI